MLGKQMVALQTGMLPPAGTPTPSESPATHAAAGLHPAAWGVQRTRHHPFSLPASPMHPPAPPSTPQVTTSLANSACCAGFAYASGCAVFASGHMTPATVNKGL